MVPHVHITNETIQLLHETLQEQEVVVYIEFFFIKLFNVKSFLCQQASKYVCIKKEDLTLYE